MFPFYEWLDKCITNVSNAKKICMSGVTQLSLLKNADPKLFFKGSTKKYRRLIFFYSKAEICILCVI